MISGMFLVSEAKEAVSSRQQLHLLLNKKKCVLLAKLYKDDCTICTVHLEIASMRHTIWCMWCPLTSSVSLVRLAWLIMSSFLNDDKYV